MTPSNRITIRKLHQLYRDEAKIAALSVYDSVTARLADQAGIHLMLVGDSMGMTVLGHKSTIPVTLEQSLHHTSAVVRGVNCALVVGDMPFLSYQITQDQAIRNAGRYLQEAGADAVKLEGGVVIAPTVRRLVDCGIPVLGHVGLLPQHINLEGGYRVVGRSDKEAESVRQDAIALQDAGAFAVILESIPSGLAKSITNDLEIPTIGIGAGGDCSGQIQVIHDILGLIGDWKPKHAKRYANLADTIHNCVTQYRLEVQDGVFPGKEHASK